MKFNLDDKKFYRLLIVFIACAVLGGMLLVGRCVKGNECSTCPYVIFVDRPVQLSDWESVEELNTFLDLSIIRLVFISGDSFDGQCEDAAFALRDAAERQGKRLETEILTRAECYRYQEHLDIPYEMIWALRQNDGHVICKAVIGNEIWFIEPSNDNYWLAYFLD